MVRSETYLPYGVGGNMSLSLDLDSLLFEHGDLKVALWDPGDNECQYELIFENPFFFSVTNESHRLRSLERISDVRASRVFTVHNSGLVSWLLEESCRTVNHDEVYHFVILTDDWIDVLSRSEPKVVGPDRR